MKLIDKMKSSKLNKNQLKKMKIMNNKKKASRKNQNKNQSKKIKNLKRANLNGL